MLIALPALLLAYAGVVILLCACRTGHLEDVASGFVDEPGRVPGPGARVPAAPAAAPLAGHAPNRSGRHLTSR